MLGFFRKVVRAPRGQGLLDQCLTQLIKVEEDLAVAEEQLTDDIAVVNEQQLVLSAEKTNLCLSRGNVEILLKTLSKVD